MAFGTVVCACGLVIMPKPTPTDLKQPKRPVKKIGRPEIIDEFTNLPVSRQRKWQLRKMAQGGCRICGQAAISGGYCLKHLVQERDHSAERFGYKRENQNCKSRLMQKLIERPPGRWRYQIISARTDGIDTGLNSQDVLIKHWGSLGWELTAAVPQADGDVWFYFKQPVPLTEALAVAAPAVKPSAPKMSGKAGPEAASE